MPMPERVGKTRGRMAANLLIVLLILSILNARIRLPAASSRAKQYSGNLLHRIASPCTIGLVCVVANMLNSYVASRYWGLFLGLHPKSTEVPGSSDATLPPSSPEMEFVM